MKQQLFDYFKSHDGQLLTHTLFARLQAFWRDHQEYALRRRELGLAEKIADQTGSTHDLEGYTRLVETRQPVVMDRERRADALGELETNRPPAISSRP